MEISICNADFSGKSTIGLLIFGEDIVTMKLLGGFILYPSPARGEGDMNSWCSLLLVQEEKVQEFLLRPPPRARGERTAFSEIVDAELTLKQITGQ